MKKSIGSTLGLYPSLVTIVGAMNDDQPTWTLVAHVGIIGHDHVLVSLASNHFINHCIKETKQLTINLTSEDMLPKVDVAGSVSGNKGDKSQLFDYEKQGSYPILKEAPLTMKCNVEDIYKTDGFESFICTIDETLVEEQCLTNNKLDFNKLKPVLFSFSNYEYISTGRVLGKCLSFKK